MNRFIEHSQVLNTTKYNTLTAFHSTNHSTLIYPFYFRYFHHNTFTVNKSSKHANYSSDLRRLISPIQSPVWSDRIGKHLFWYIVEKECLPLGCLVTSYNDVLTVVVCIRCCENVYGVVSYQRWHPSIVIETAHISQYNNDIHGLFTFTHLNSLWWSLIGGRNTICVD
jgi:hypothetical protein